MVSLLYVHLKHCFLESVRWARLEKMSRLVRYEGKHQVRWMALKKAAFALHIFNSHIDETATASSTEFCII